MKRFVYFTILMSIFLGVDVKGQQENFLGLCFGGAIPQGSFSDDDFTNKTNGYANTGFLFSFDAAWFPDEYLGVGATVTFASNNPDKTQYMSDFKNSIMDSISLNDPDLAELINESIVLDYGVWKYLNFFVGPNVTFPAGNFNFDLRLMGGVSFAWKPYQTIDINYPEEGSFSRKIEDKAVPALGYSVGGGIRYAFKSGYVLRFIAEYANCKPTFEYITKVSYNEEEESFDAETDEIQMPIKNIHLGIGIAYNFEL